MTPLDAISFLFLKGTHSYPTAIVTMDHFRSVYIF